MTLFHASITILIEILTGYCKNIILTYLVDILYTHIHFVTLWNDFCNSVNECKNCAFANSRSN